MVPTYTKRNNTRVRYYTCRSAQMRGWKSCPAKTLPAREIEEAVLAKLQSQAVEPTSLKDLVERISYDGATRQVSMTLREGAICA
jgi:site-specific DNA recombinase